MRRSTLATRSRPGLGALDALHVLNAAAEAVAHHALGAGLAGEPVVVSKLQAFLSLVVDVGEAEQVADDFAGRVVASIFALQVHAGHVQGLHLRRRSGTHVPPQIEKGAIRAACDPAQQIALVDLQRVRQRGEIGAGVGQLARIRPHGIHRRAHCQRLAVAIGDRAAMRGDLFDAKMTRLALLGEKSFVEDLQMHGARRQADERQRKGREHQAHAPAQTRERAFTGARWSPEGAEDILKLRAVVVNGDLGDYMRYYKTRYREERHLARYDEASVEHLNLAA